MKPRMGTEWHESEEKRADIDALWPIVRLGDVATTASGGTPKRTVSAYYGGGIPWVKSGELGDRTVYETEETISELGLENSSAKVFPKGTLCIALYGATVGKLGILGVDAATNQAVCGLFLPAALDRQFAYRFLESKRKNLVEMGKGGAQSNISQEIIRDIRLPMPPLSEQRRIVAEIEKQFTRLDAGVAALQRVQAGLKRYRAAVLKAACEGKLVPTEAELHRSKVAGQSSKASAPDRSYESGEALLRRILAERRAKWNGRGKYKEPVVSDTTELTELPDGWVWSTIGQLAEVGTGATPNRGNSKFYLNGTIPWVTSGSLNGALIDKPNELVTATALEQCNLTVYPPGTLLVAMYGEGKTRGMTSELTISAATNQAIAALQSPKAVRGFLKIALWANYEDMRKAASGGVQPNLNLTIVRSIPVPLPPPSEQKRIVAEVERRLSLVEELEATVSANLQRAARLRQAVLRRAFSGHP